jgi:uncharacterized protein YdeI (YjbR/CyaY-like superfamily)
MSKTALDQYEQFYPVTRAEWREWLAKNHATSPGVWLVYYKKESGKPRIAHEDAVAEALCFGWIDSKAKGLDSERTIQLFTRRKSKSPWSKINKALVEQLIAEGLMTPAGMEKIETAKQNGMWTAYDSVEALIVPDDLQSAFSANPTAEQHFNAFSNSSKKIILRWIESAKKPETRQKRVEETVRLAAQNIKANHPE